MSPHRHLKSTVEMSALNTSVAPVEDLVLSEASRGPLHRGHGDEPGGFETKRQASGAGEEVDGLRRISVQVRPGHLVVKTCKNGAASSNVPDPAPRWCAPPGLEAYWSAPDTHTILARARSCCNDPQILFE